MLLLLALAAVTVVLGAWLGHVGRHLLRHVPRGVPPLQGAAADRAAAVFDSADRLLDEAGAGFETEPNRLLGPAADVARKRVVQVNPNDSIIPTPRGPDVILPSPRSAADDQDLGPRPRTR